MDIPEPNNIGTGGRELCGGGGHVRCFLLKGSQSPNAGWSQPPHNEAVGQRYSFLSQHAAGSGYRCWHT